MEHHVTVLQYFKLQAARLKEGMLPSDVSDHTQPLSVSGGETLDTARGATLMCLL